jgi:hypothetical protein
VQLESEDNEPESEENDLDSTPYPLEGKYIDEADKRRLVMILSACKSSIKFCRRLQQMSEIEREGILEQRLEEMQRVQDTRNLDQLVKAQKSADPDGTKIKRMSPLCNFRFLFYSLVIAPRNECDPWREQREESEA